MCVFVCVVVCVSCECLCVRNRWLISFFFNASRDCLLFVVFDPIFYRPLFHRISFRMFAGFTICFVYIFSLDFRFVRLGKAFFVCFCYCSREKDQFLLWTKLAMYTTWQTFHFDFAVRHENNCNFHSNSTLNSALTQNKKCWELSFKNCHLVYY